MRGSLWIVGAALVLALAAVVVAPAAWLDRPLASRTDGRLRLIDARGPWWRGHGTLATADGVARVPIAWRTALAPLVTGTLEVDLDASTDDGAPSGHVSATRGGVELRGLRLHAPARMIAALVPGLQAVALGGDVTLHAPSFAWRHGAASGTLSATWERARLGNGSLALDLGHVTLSAAPSGDGALAGTVRNDGGDVAIAGTATDRAGIVDAALVLRPAPGAPDAVRTFLPLLGTPDGTGAVRVTWRNHR